MIGTYCKIIIGMNGVGEQMAEVVIMFFTMVLMIGLMVSG